MPQTLQYAKAAVGFFASVTLFAAILMYGFADIAFVLDPYMVLVLLAVMSATLGVDIIEQLQGGAGDVTEQASSRETTTYDANDRQGDE